MNNKIEISGKIAFYIFLLVVGSVIITIWITGLDVKRTIYNNAFYSLSLITFLFFTFVTVGLYNGMGIKDNFGNIKSKIGLVEPSGISGDLPIGEFASEGIEGIIIGILMWIGITILLIILLFFFETIVFAGLVIITGTLYWIFYRATHLILRYSRLTKHNLGKSMWIGFRYSLMYSGWLYGIIWIIEIMKNK